VRGQFLTLQNGYLVFTTGAAIPIGKSTIPKGLTLGRFVRVRIESATHEATAVSFAPNALPGDLDADHLPSAFVTGTSAERKPEANAASTETVTVVVEVLVPPSTPSSDDIYFTTERTSFSPAELKMTRLDAQRWSIQLSVASGAMLRYRFTRGTNTTAERNAAGVIDEPHVLTAKAGLHTHDTVARWADST
jgi:hypothetical protein